MATLVSLSPCAKLFLRPTTQSPYPLPQEAYHDCKKFAIPIILAPMIATYINSLAVIIGSLLGLLIGSRLKEQFKEVVYASAGLVTIVIGIQMALQTQSFLVLLFSIVV